MYSIIKEKQFSLSLELKCFPQSSICDAASVIDLEGMWFIISGLCALRDTGNAAMSPTMGRRGPSASLSTASILSLCMPADTLSGVNVLMHFGCQNREK